MLSKSFGHIRAFSFFVTLLYLPYKEYHTRHGKRHLSYKEMTKIRLFHVNKMAAFYSQISSDTISIQYFPQTS